MYEMFWLLLVVVLTAIEIATMGLTTIWFAGGALVAWIAALLHANIIVQIILFLVVSIVLLVFTRPVALKYLNKDKVKTNVDSLIGQDAVVLEEIDNLNEKGKVRVNGLEWTARTLENQEIIQPGDIVSILSISGVKLIVKRKEE